MQHSHISCWTEAKFPSEIQNVSIPYSTTLILHNTDIKVKCVLLVLTSFVSKPFSFKLSKRHTCWIKIDQLDVTCFIISLFTAQHVSSVSTSIFRSLRHFENLFHVLYCSGSMCVGVTVWFGWGGVDVLTFETCWAVNSEIMKQVTSSWSLFIQLSRWCTVR
jgi:hypothetical protein